MSGISTIKDFSIRKDLPKVLFIAVTYFIAHGIASFFPDSQKIIMMVWPAGGISLAAFLLSPRRLWPALTAAFIIAGITGDILLVHRSFLSGAGYMTGNMVESLGCAWMILFINPDFHKFKQVREVLTLIVSAVLINAISSCIGAGTSVLTQNASFTESWRLWYISDGLGILLVCPFIVCWIVNFWGSAAKLGSKRIIESIAFIITWSAFSYIVFFQINNAYFSEFHPYMLVALLAWPAMRFGMRGLTTALIILFIIEIASAETLNLSPFKGEIKLMHNILLDDQIFLAFLAFVGYLMSASYSSLRRVERSLRKSEEQYRTIIETAMDGFCMTDKNGHIIHVNAAYCRITGYTREELLNMRIADIEAIESAKESYAHMQKIIAKGEDRFETIHHKKDGSLIDFEINVQYKESEGGRFAVFLHDITNRKRIEAEIIKSESLYQDLFENAPDMFISIDAETTKIIQCNNTFAKMTKYSKEEIIGRTVFEMNSPESQEKAKNAFMQFMKSGELKDIELQLRKKDGGIIDARLNATAVRENGKIIQSRSILRDVTELRRGEKEIKTILFTAMDGFYLVDTEGRILETNDAYCKMIGYTHEELLTMKVKDIEASETEEEIKKRINEILKTGSIRFETKHRRKDGSIIIVEASVNYLIEEQPKLFCFIRDITEPSKAEEALRESEERYRILSEISPEMIYLIDTNGKLTYLNKASAAPFKVNPSEIIGKHIEEIFPAEISTRLMEGIQNVIHSKTSSYTERKIRFPFEEKWMGVRLCPVFDKEYNVTSVLGLSIDISERKMAEKELLKLSRAVEQSSASVVITNCRGDIEFVNQTLCDLTGFTKEELIGKNPRIWKSGYHTKEYYKEFWNTLLSGQNCSGEILNKKKNGELYWESALISPLINENGEITHFVAVKEDITEKKKMVTALVEAKEEAESANRLKDAFIANISHEIRTPLNGVLGMTHLIKELFQGNIKAEDEELFDGVDNSSKRIIRTVDMILNYSRLQVGEFNVQPSKINISLILTELVSEFSTSAKHKSLELKFLNEYENAEITADENSITIAISNLIDNAIKYTHKGFVEIKLHKEKNGDIIVDVKDTGIGISPVYLEHIFEPYRQEQMGYGRAYDGIGLGLALVKKVLDLNNAVISVESKKGEGTAFSINFGNGSRPTEVRSEKGQGGDMDPVEKAKQRKLVLIVEDDLMNQITIKRFIDDLYDTMVTNSSDEAMDIIRNTEVDLILMDISINGSMNGLELTKALKGSGEFYKIPVIAVTAHAFESDKKKALEAGCDRYLAKPFTKIMLRKTLEEFE